MISANKTRISSFYCFLTLNIQKATNKVHTFMIDIDSPFHAKYPYVRTKCTKV